jgi:cytohesin
MCVPPAYPRLRNPQTLESFISMNRGIDQGKDLPPELLTDLFNSISASPFKLPEEEAGLSYTFFNPERAGWLQKEGGQHKTWKRRWFTLANNCLYYFESPESVKPKGTIPLESLHVRECTDAKRQHCFEIIAEQAAVGKAGAKGALSIKGAKTNRKGQIVLGKHSSYKIQAADRTEMEEWIKCIRAAMQKDPVYEMYRLKKLRVT